MLSWRLRWLPFERMWIRLKPMSLKSSRTRVVLRLVGVLVQLLIPYFVHPWFACQTPKNPKILFSPHKVTRTSRVTWRNPFGHRNTQSAFSAKMTKMPLVKLGLNEGQTRSKSTQNNNSHSFSPNASFSEIFSHFDQVWPKIDFRWAQEP